MEIGVRNRL